MSDETRRIVPRPAPDPALETRRQERLEDIELGPSGGGGGGEPDPPRRRSGLWLFLLLVAAAGLGVFLWWQFFLIDKEPPAAAPAPAPALPAPPVAQPEPEAAELEPVEPLNLPPLDASDAFVRELIEGLGNYPELARWLAPEHLVRRFVAAVDNIAEGQSPRTHLQSLSPPGSFAVEERDGEIFIDPAAYRRYDPLASFLTSLDTAAVVRLYRGLEPLFDEAYEQLGYPDRDFRTTLGQAIRRLLATPVVEGDVAVTRRILSYEYAEPRLQGLSAAQRDFLRMGPRNVQRMKSKLREIESALRL